MAEVFAEEQGYLHKLPEHPFESDALLPGRSGKTHYVRFNSNDYSITHTAVGLDQVLAVSEREVRVLDGAVEIARHVCFWDRRQLIDDPAHKEALLAEGAARFAPAARRPSPGPSPKPNCCSVPHSTLASLIPVPFAGSRPCSGLGHRPAVRRLDLGDRPEFEALHVQPHSLEDYDDLTDEDDH